VRDLAPGPRRFVELQRVLPGISTEQLRSRLNRMVADGMLTRKRYREVPPRVDYELTERARELMPILASLARWGYDWAWSSPRVGESVDLGAIFRLAPGLINSADISGTIQLVVTDAKDGEAASFAITVDSGRVTVSETSAERPDATVSGDQAGWISVFAPPGDRDHIAVSGNQELAGQLLDHLVPASAVSARAAA
jgi:DNA-binding HxlR family transcriptional regulator